MFLKLLSGGGLSRTQDCFSSSSSLYALIAIMQSEGERPRMSREEGFRWLNIIKRVVIRWETIRVLYCVAAAAWSPDCPPMGKGKCRFFVATQLKESIWGRRVWGRSAVRKVSYCKIPLWSWANAEHNTWQDKNWRHHILPDLFTKNIFPLIQENLQKKPFIVSYLVLVKLVVAMHYQHNTGFCRLLSLYLHFHNHLRSLGQVSTI